MFSLFRARPPVGEDEYGWLVACFAWLQRSLDPTDPFRQSQLVLPSAEHFPGAAKSGHARAQELFDQTRWWLGMDEWPCALVMQDKRRETHIGPGQLLRHETDLPLGTFSVDRDKVVVTYDPDLLSRPERLIATFAHELAHYLLAGLGPPPGGEELSEHATDCAAAYLGFGVLLTNSAFEFRQFGDSVEIGWQSSASGYLSEPALVTATALFVHCTQSDEGAAQRALKPSLRKPFAKALSAIRVRLPAGPADLAEVDLTEWN